MEIETLMAQGRSTKIISMIKWIQTSRLSIKTSLPRFMAYLEDVILVWVWHHVHVRPLNQETPCVWRLTF